VNSEGGHSERGGNGGVAGLLTGFGSDLLSVRWVRLVRLVRLCPVGVNSDSLRVRPERRLTGALPELDAPEESLEPLEPLALLEHEALPKLPELEPVPEPGGNRIGPYICVA